MKQPGPLDYASRGWPVVPIFEIVKNGTVCSCGRKPGADCSPGKHPRTAHGLSDASTDPDMIKAWMKQWPKSNWAILTGAGSGIVVIDVDPKHGGLDSIKALTDSDVPNDAWGTDVIQKTGSGGYHLLFKHPGKPIRNKVGLRPGLDVRGDGGYIIVAPSGHISGGVYGWLNSNGHAPPPITDWANKLLAERKSAAPIADVIPDHQRNHTLTSFAGSMRQRGADEEMILNALLLLNQKRCRPPLDEAEVRGIAKSIATNYAPGAEAVGPIGRLASDFNMRRIDWLWPGRLALGMLAVLDGDPSLGKSTLLADMAAHITTGRDWPDGTRCPIGGVIIVGAEDSVEQVWVPRLKAAGADLSKVLIIGVITGADGKPRLPSLPEHVALFEKAIIDMGAKLIGFDPIMPYLSKTANANSDKDVRQCLTPLADMLDRVNCCGLMLRHFAKSDKVANALYRGLGSIAFNGLARTAMAVSKVPTETGADVPESMSLMVTKNNIGLKPRSRRYRIEAADLGGGIVTSRIAWGDASNDRPDDLLTEAGRATKPGEQAQDFLRTVLADGPRLATEVEALAEAEGITKITLRRARVKLRIASAPTDFKGPWMMQLPPEL